MGARFLTVGEGVKMQKKRKLERTLQCWFGIWGISLNSWTSINILIAINIVLCSMNIAINIDVKVCVYVYTYIL